MFEDLAARGFQIEFHSHATAILSVDFPDAIGELEAALGALSIPIEEIIGSGGGETKGTQRLRRALAELICPLLSGPEAMIVWTTKGTLNAEQEAQAGRDYRQAT